MKFQNAKITGVGTFLPPYYTTTEEVAQALPGSWPAERVIEKIGVKSRYFLHELDIETGKTKINPNRHSNDMAYMACCKALEMAQLDPEEIDGLIHVTCTPDEPYFSWPAIGVANKLGMRHENVTLQHLPSGCGGMMEALRAAKERIIGSNGLIRRMLLVASNYPSAYFDKDAYLSKDGIEHPIPSWLSLQLFGDAASALILEGTEDPERGFIHSITRWMPDELVRNRGGGAKYPSYRCEVWRNTFLIEGRLVEQKYREFMTEMIPRLLSEARLTIKDVTRFYLHPANRKLVEDVIGGLGIPVHHVPINVDVIGNVSAAATPYLLSADLSEGKVKLGNGTIALFAALGAGVHAGAHLIRL